ncbi:MAG: hypothetical protein IH605_02510 [Burkholderiales bacterium]|nr:hypothetical protein [Burkholderiales bacterium]
MSKSGIATAYQAKVGSYTASSDARKGDRLLLNLVVELGMDGAGGRCVAELSGTDCAPVKLGEAVSVELDAGEGMTSVFTGEAAAVEVTATSQRVTAWDGMAMLGCTEVEEAYEDVTADFVVKDLMEKAGVTPGTVAKGPDLPAYAVHRGPRALAHLRRLAEMCGADLYTDGEGKVHFDVPKQGGADHEFQFGENILVMALEQPGARADSVEVWGEGAASAKGADKAHWLSTDLSGVNGKASVDDSGKAAQGKLGDRPMRILNGALRSGSAAGDSANARMDAVASRWIRGRLEVFGAPGVMPGDLVEVKKLPSDHAAAKFLTGGTKLRVRCVRHALDRRRGLITRIEF